MCLIVWTLRECSRVTRLGFLCSLVLVIWFYSGVLCVVFLCLFLYVYAHCPVVLYCRVIAASLESDCPVILYSSCNALNFHTTRSFFHERQTVGSTKPKLTSRRIRFRQHNVIKLVNYVRFINFCMGIIRLILLSLSTWLLLMRIGQYLHLESKC
jgi:hypothetical protein